MSTPRDPRIEALFLESVLMEPERREAWLADACGGDAELHAAVVALLRHHDAAGSFLERPAMTPRSGSAADAEAEERAMSAAGTRIGRFEILGVLGRGGMGVVYRARQEQPARTVALKIVRPGLMSERLLRRFEHEIELLGRLEHPGIARVYEAGTRDTDEGPEPWFAMELVDGLPLIAHAQAAELSTRDRLGLLAEVADAVQHAHERAVIHRDLKPGNIFVDGAGRPRILDFGIARATDSDLQQTTVHTDVGEILGTLAYMSPEQLKSGRDIDTRADIYALGVIGYELVAGRLPHDITGKPLVDALSTLTTAEPPTLGSLNHRLRGDIEVLIGKAMERNRERRYASAAEFAADIRRFLNDEPILARPPSAAYQLRKLIARHRGPVAAAATLLITIVVFAAWMTVLYAESDRNRRRAERERKSAEAVTEFLGEMLAQADPTGAREADPTVRQLLDGAAGRLDRTLASEPGVSATLHATIGRSYRALGRFAEADSHLVKARAYWVGHGGEESVAYAAVENAIANLRRVQGRLAEAESLLRINVERRRRLQPGSEALAQSMSSLGVLMTERGHLAEADSVMGEVETLFRTSVGLDNVHRPEALNIRAIARQERGDFAGAESLLTEGLRIQRLNWGPSHANVALVLGSIALGRQRQGHFAEAEPVYREAIAILRQAFDNRNPNLASYLSNLGAVLRELKRPAEAESLLLESVAMERAMNPGLPDGWKVGAYLTNLGDVQADQGEWARAETTLSEAATILIRGLGPTHRRVGTVRASLGRVLLRQGRRAEGHRELSAALPILEASLGPDDPRTRRVRAERDAAGGTAGGAGAAPGAGNPR